MLALIVHYNYLFILFPMSSGYYNYKWWEADKFQAKKIRQFRTFVSQEYSSNNVTS